MNIHRLEYLVTVVNTGSFSEAAEVLYTTQGAVSKQIISLENELNVKLFQRNARKASLTEDGKYVVFYAQDILKTYGEMQKTLTSSRQEHDKRKYINLAVVPVYRIYNIHTLIDSFANNNPSISLRIEEREYGEFINPLEKGDFEMAIGPEELIDDNKYDCLGLNNDSLSVAMPASHPLANEKSLKIYQLRQEKFIFLSKIVGMYDECMTLCNKNGFFPQVMHMGSHPENISQIIEREGYICLAMGKITKSMRSDTIVSVPVEDGFTSTISLIRPKKIIGIPAVEKFWNYARNYAS